MGTKRWLLFDHEARCDLEPIDERELERLDALHDELALDDAYDSRPPTPEEQRMDDELKERLNWLAARTPEELDALRELRSAQLASGRGTWSELIRRWRNRS